MIIKQKNTTKKKDRLKTIVISWVSMFLIGGLVGGIGVGLTAYAQNRDNDQLEDAANLYGTRDGKTFANAEEMSVNLETGDGSFKPLDVALDKDIQEFAFYLAKGYYIDFSFVMAVMESESGFNPAAESKTNDSGLMQINKCNHKWLSEKLGITDFHDPYQNIRAGLYILRNLFEKYDDPAKVLMAYNMGEYGASVLWKQGTVETSYSRKILNRANEFENMLTESA